MPSVAATLATMIGLGVGIDYALFIVTRHKLQLREGMEMRRVDRPRHRDRGRRRRLRRLHGGDRALLARLRRDPAGHTLGFTAAIAVVVAVFAAATLLPAMLGALGPRINSLRVHARQDPPRRPRAARLAALGASGGRAAVALGDRARWSVLVVLALPISQLKLGQNDISALPEVDTTARQAYDGAQQRASARASTGRS